MTAQRPMRFVHWHLAWMVGTVLVLSVLGALSVALFVLLAVVGLLVVAELTAPFNVTPRWRSRLRWLLVLALAGFVLVAIRRLVEVLPGGFV